MKKDTFEFKKIDRGGACRKGVRVMTTDEMFEIYIGEINDYLPYEYVQQVKNSLQYKEFVKELEKQENDFIDKLIEQSELDYNL